MVSHSRGTEETSLVTKSLEIRTPVGFCTVFPLPTTISFVIEKIIVFVVDSPLLHSEHFTILDHFLGKI